MPWYGKLAKAFDMNHTISLHRKIDMFFAFQKYMAFYVNSNI